MAKPSEKQELRMAQTLMGILRAGKKVREPWEKVRKEAWQYAYDSTYSFLYQDWENRNGELFFKAKIPKAAQFIEVMGPYLYQYNPTYTIEAERTTDPLSWDDRRIEVEKKYLAFSVKRGDQYTHCRRAIDDALCGGRGVLWTGYNQRRSCVQHVFDSSANLIDDPDARTVEERNLIFRERLKPRWELAAMYPQKLSQIAGIKKAGGLPSGMVAATSGGKDSEIVRYYECWMRVPLSHYAEGLDVKELQSGETAGTELKYVFTEEVLLSSDTWEIPWYLDDMWPAETLDLLKKPDSIYGVSSLDTSLGLIRALNWAHTLILSKLQVSTRLAFVVMNTNGEKMPVEQLLKIVNGEHFDIAVLNQLSGNEFPELGKMIQQLDIKTGVDDLVRLTAILDEQIEMSSGLYSILFAGNTSTQLRTAEDAKLKGSKSRTRIDDRRTQVEKYTTALGQKARFAARYLEGADDMARLFGTEAGQAWGEIADPQAVQANKQKRQQVFQMAGQQAFDQAQQQAQQMMVTPPPMGQPAPMPPDPSAAAQQAGMQAADQYAPDNVVDFSRWMLDAGVSIESGSMRRKDVDQAGDAFDQAGNTVIPAMLQNPNPAVQAIAMRIAARGMQIRGAPPELVADINEAAEIIKNTPPPMPAPAPAQGAA